MRLMFVLNISLEMEIILAVYKWGKRQYAYLIKKFLETESQHSFPSSLILPTLYKDS